MSVTPKQNNPADTPVPEKDMKRELRRALLGKRGALDEVKRIRWSRKIGEYVADHVKTKALSSLGVYLPIRNEPDLTALYIDLTQKGIALSLPIITEKAAPLQFAEWIPGDVLVEDSLGILTPQTRRFIPLPEVLLIPCLGFTPDRYRLGYGGGYFDRTLEQKNRPYTIGVAYACSKTRFPVYEHDIALDCIITESGII